MSGTAEINKISVLVVDDDEDFVEILARRLQRRGLDCNGVLCGAEAIKSLKERDFDVVLLDVRLSDMNGNDILLEIKKTKPETQVVLLSGYASAKVGREGLFHGAYDYLIKPVEFESLYEKLMSAALNNTKTDADIKQ